MEQKSSYLKIALVTALIILIFLILLLIGISRQTNPRSTNAPTPSPLTLPTEALPSVEPTIAAIITQTQSPFDENLYAISTQTEREENPDLTVTNSLPYENEWFTAKSIWVAASPGYFKIQIEAKAPDEEVVKKAVQKWLQNLQLSEKSIQKLSIEYVFPQ